MHGFTGGKHDFSSASSAFIGYAVMESGNGWMPTFNDTPHPWIDASFQRTGLEFMTLK